MKIKNYKSSYCTAYGLKRILKRSLKKITKYYKTLSYKKSKTKSDEHIYDSFYLISKKASQTAKALKDIHLVKAESEKLPRMYLLLREEVRDFSFCIDTKNIIDKLSCVEKKAYITNEELEFIPLGIKIAAIELIADSIEKSDEGIDRGVELLYTAEDIDLRRIHDEKNNLQKLLYQDSVFEAMDTETQNLYKYMVEKTAAKLKTDELELVREYLNASKGEHIGKLIYKNYKKYVLKKAVGKKVFWLMAVLSFFITLIICKFTTFYIFVPILFLSYEIVRPLAEYLALFKASGELPPRLKVKRVDKDSKTLVTLSTLIPSLKDLPELEKKLERLYLTNDIGEIGFCVLADLKEANLPTLHDDKILINAAKGVINKLNEKYGNKFLLAVRSRSYSKTQDKYTGSERKRGAISELVNVIMGERTDSLKLYGNKALLNNVKYILALDYDTKIMLDSVAKLVSVANHPLNKPVIDDKKNIVTKGYGILSPRIVNDLKTSFKTPFSKIMGGIAGISSYEQRSANLYGDLFGIGIFSGKGLINVECFYKVLKNRFPPETVLSHDILEGGYLRTLYVPDVEFIDSFPEDSTSYFKRLHRWIRGDFQNILFLKKKINYAGKTYINSLPKINKYQLFDNIRRALIPIVALLCTISALFVGGYTRLVLIIFSVLSVIFSYLFSIFVTTLYTGLFDFKRKYYSDAVSQVSLSMAQMLYTLVFLPQSALISLDASLRALYRLFISHKNLLEWQTAKQVSSSKSKAISTIKYYMPAQIIGLILFIFGTGLLRLIGILFSGVILLAFTSKRKVKTIRHELSDTSKQQLISDLMLMCSFYDDLAGKKDNFLPPDNIMLAPKRKVAHRTSPTNIGLMLLSLLTARDFNLIDTPTLFDKVDATICTIEKLKKFHGNLYNWYDTQTLEVLKPEYVSTVDSGNFVCALVALKEGLKEYEKEDKRMEALISSVERIISQTDIGIFYNEQKQLFSIGYDISQNKLSKSHYDMLMSEARMTSYFAIAKRMVPQKHWGALSKTLARQGNFTGPVSWTGTMFEYFMPELLLHNIEGSLGYEALRFCIHCQKRRTQKLGVPFGISESCFYAFDAEFNYQYKANGVQKIALKRGMNEDIVISPYSSYLVMPFDRLSAYKNLNRLRDLGAYSKYGFYEAVDFTPERVGKSEYKLIKSYMAHHLGMSICAVNNTLNDNILQKRFMADKDMKKAKELLQEKISVGDIMFKDVDVRYIKSPNKPKSEEEVLLNLNPVTPRVKLISNEEVTCVTTDVGTQHIMYQGLDATVRTTDILTNPKGTFSFIKVDNTVIPFSFAPMYDNKFYYNTSFDNDSVTYTTAFGGIQAGFRITEHRSLPVVQYRFAVKNTSHLNKKGTLLTLIEPILCAHKDFVAHPAFSKLFVSVQKCEDFDNLKILIVQRKTRKNEPLMYMGIAFLENIPFSYETKRENILKRGLYFTLCDDIFERPLKEGSGAPDVMLALRTKLNLPPNVQKSLTLLVGVGSSKKEVINNLLRIRKDGMIDSSLSAKSKIASGSIESLIIKSLLPKLLFGTRDLPTDLNINKEDMLPKNALWGLSISADYPIVLVEVIGKNDTDRVAAYLNVYMLLKLQGIDFDLVFSYKDDNTLEMINRQLQIYGCMSRLKKNAGIHLVNALNTDKKVYELLKIMACSKATKSIVKLDIPAKPFEKVTFNRVNKIKPQSKICLEVQGCEFDEKSVYIVDTPKLPWCHILANATFGTLLSDRALGFTFAINARENKLTKWTNDIIADNNGEMLLAQIGDKYYNLLSNVTARFSPDFAIYYGEVCGIEYSIKVTVPKKGMYKDIELKLNNTLEDRISLKLCFYFEVCLDVTRDGSKNIFCEQQENYVYLYNPNNISIPSHAAISLDRIFNVVCEKSDVLCGRWDKIKLTATNSFCSALITKMSLKGNQGDKVKCRLSFGKTKQSALKMLELNDEQVNTDKPNSLRVNLPDKELEIMVNTWLWHQTLASRFYARTGFYQCSGAYGFRDQLQDVNALITIYPLIAKRHILRCCLSQFEEGDVLHWWHNLGGFGGGKKGVRTHYSDDMLWLAFTLCEYIDKTGDMSILNLKVRYIKEPPLKDDEHDRYISAKYTDYKESVYMHSVKAIERALDLGEHGLPKIKGGDWNDGYNEVGALGKGESVWLAQFLSIVLKKMSFICDKVGDNLKAELYRDKAAKLIENVDKYCYENGYYIRAFFDNGDKLGAKDNIECSIDSLTQSFSAIADMPDKDRVNSALNMAYDKLVDEGNNLIKLFKEPFDISEQNVGYVKAYPKGIRENGGQYTHAAVWLALAFLKNNDSKRGYELIKMLNPLTHAKDERYMLEPYYIAGDIYTNQNAFGRGGWSMYTGAAGWYYLTITEYLLGIKLRQNELILAPNIPKEWEGYSANLHYNGMDISLRVINKNKTKGYEKSFLLDKPKMDLTVEI